MTILSRLLLGSSVVLLSAVKADLALAPGKHQKPCATPFDSTFAFRVHEKRQAVEAHFATKSAWWKNKMNDKNEEEKNRLIQSSLNGYFKSLKTASPVTWLKANNDDLFKSIDQSMEKHLQTASDKPSSPTGKDDKNGEGSGTKKNDDPTTPPEFAPLTDIVDEEVEDEGVVDDAEEVPPFDESKLVEDKYVQIYGSEEGAIRRAHFNSLLDTNKNHSVFLQYVGYQNIAIDGRLYGRKGQVYKEGAQHLCLQKVENIDKDELKAILEELKELPGMGEESDLSESNKMLAPYLFYKNVDFLLKYRSLREKMPEEIATLKAFVVSAAQEVIDPVSESDDLFQVAHKYGYVINKKLDEFIKAEEDKKIQEQKAREEEDRRNLNAFTLKKWAKRRLKVLQAKNILKQLKEEKSQKEAAEKERLQALNDKKQEIIDAVVAWQQDPDVQLKQALKNFSAACLQDCSSMEELEQHGAYKEYNATKARLARIEKQQQTQSVQNPAN